MAEKIFVSSSQMDLPIYRKAVQKTLLGMHVEPIMMEYFEASRLTGTRASLRYVEESDIFVLIIGWRYGFPPPGFVISVTEMEYEAALKTQMPILVYLAERETLKDPISHHFVATGINIVATSTETNPRWTWEQMWEKHQAFCQRVLT